ncbi:MAG: low molecular weight phosphatase family protein [Deltaproteobacteria bacterium CG11_big_fil_rev_8_21_14_0_20_45_16]|nr:MAG: low molecular weight phosphatase family protein [Deltaproteobacteria bacterium CG11_big_fil_rev_8_21_14_0_20_45_16]
MKRILFLCVANSARSQMAEGMARSLLGESVHVESAGSSPTQLSPVAIQVMRELDIDISNQFSKSVESIKNPETIGFIITLCGEEVCPTFFGRAKRLHWPLEDPVSDAVNPTEAFRKVRDQIRQKITLLGEELMAAAGDEYQ